MEFIYDSFTLSNLLTCAIESKALQPFSVVQLHYKVGSRNDSRHRKGIAHINEHMMYQHKLFPDKSFRQIINDCGGISSGATWLDFTTYTTIIDTAYLQDLLAFEANRMKELIISEEDLSIEKRIIHQEYQQMLINHPFMKVEKQLIHMIFSSNHPYRNLPYGSKSSVNLCTSLDIKKFHESYYGPNNSILSVSTPLGKDEVINMIYDSFDDIQPRLSEPLDGLFSFGRIHTKKMTYKEKPSRIYIAYRVSNIHSLERYCANLFVRVLSDGVNCRFNALQFLDYGCELYPLEHDSVFVAWCSVGQREDIKTGQSRLIYIMEECELSSSEIDRAVLREHKEKKILLDHSLSRVDMMTTEVRYPLSLKFMSLSTDLITKIIKKIFRKENRYILICEGEEND
ncbi:M16 family metallopeptidase [Paenibacillus sp. DMB20]|uniref:M16 family metallopeptidase n=1 Tax=Paenibacillus sp. DMB20 TaxID=1642570 RepID=UPI000627B8E2|nr:insulinase family protein [Paenibacillus sp. DMB20]KKO53469.1 hypothetical protein XI25_12790 [Paenibacillus sp. DMB20]